MILLQPPFIKSCEPSAALAQLSAHLKGNGVACHPHDLNIEALYYLVEQAQCDGSTRSKRAHKNRDLHLLSLQQHELYSKLPRYQRAISDINFLLEQSGKKYGVQLNLGNYGDQALSPQRSENLLQAAEEYKNNIFTPLYQRSIPKLLAEYAPQYIGISLNFLSQALPAFALIGYLREVAPDCKIIVGGGLVSSWHKSPHWQNRFTSLVDHFVVGAGEEPLLDIVQKQRVPSKNSLPDYEELYHNKYLAPGRILPYTASTGCYWRKCSFCPETSENNPYLTLKTARMSSELKELGKKYQPSLIHFLDSAISPKHMSALAAAPPVSPWYGFARICEQLTDYDFALSLKKSGCAMLKLGLESGSAPILEAMNKGITLQLASRVLRNLERVGIATYVYLLFGTPEETINEARQTLEFTREHASAITYTNLSIFNLPICSPEAKILENSGIHEGDLTLYTDFIHPKGWSRQHIRKFLNQEFKKQGEIAPILQRNPHFFTSNHAPFFSF